MSEETRVIIDMALLMVISGLCCLIFAKIKMPPILGYLVAGIILGPTMFPDLWVEETTVMILSNLGIVVLMFWIGLELSAAKLKQTGSVLIIILLVEMTLMVVIGYLVGILIGMSDVQAIFLGAVISGTSTAVVVEVLRTNKAITGPQASMIIGITVFEDVGQVIILTMAAPLLAGDAPALGSTLNMVVGLVLFFGLTIMLGVAFIPRMMDYIGSSYSGEILFVISIGLCFTMAMLSSSLGLSIAIGAFLMGIIISLSMFNKKIMVRVTPLKELFMAVFFISIGLQIDPQLIFANLWLVVIVAGTFISAKILSVVLACYVTNIPSKDAFVIATSLVAMGEFAFIIAKIAFDAGVVEADFYSAVIGAALITMIVLPLLSKVQLKIFDGIVRTIPKSARSALTRIEEFRVTASQRIRSSRENSRELRKEVFLIFLDYLIIILILLLFQVINEVRMVISDIAEEYNIVPELLLVFFMVLAIAPAVVHIYRRVRRTSELLTSIVVGSDRYLESSRKNVYRIFVNLGELTMLVLVLLLIFPFIPNITTENPIVIAMVVTLSICVVILGWNTLRNGYDKFYVIITQSGVKKENEDGD